MRLFFLCLSPLRGVECGGGQAGSRSCVTVAADRIPLGDCRALLLLFGRGYLEQDWPVIRQNWARLAMMGATGFAIFNFFLYSALVHTTAINVTIIQAGMPMFIFPSSVRVWLVVLFTAIFPALLAQGFYIRAVGLIGPNPATLFLIPMA